MSQGGSHPQVGARCYLPEKIYFDRMKNSSHVMKDLKMTNKLRVFGFAIFEKIGSFIFWWLRHGF